MEVIFNPFKRRLSETEVKELLQKYNPDGIIAGVESLTLNVLESAPKLKIISRCGVGMDSVDLNAAIKLGIKVFNTPEAPTKAVGELAAAMIFSLVRGLYIYKRDMKNKEWISFNGGFLHEKTLGIIGCGRIGTQVARLLQPTGCHIIAYDTKLDKHPLCKLVDLEYLIKNADIISLHLPYSNENHHMIGSNQIKTMKKGTILVNVSRGGLVDEEALYQGLVSGQLGGAGLDVFEEEPYSGPLTGLDNVILTPHIASSAGNSRLKMEEEAVKNLISGLKELSLI